MFCQVFVNFQSVVAISETQKLAIIDNCEAIRENLKNVQKLDSRMRVFFGQHFEAILSKFIIPLNLRLVENSLSNTNLIENQNEFASKKTAFAADFISYQQELENLMMLDCKSNPEKFYEKIEVVRGKREIVFNDVARMKKLITKNMQLVEKMKAEV
ncbi:hypothetical protein IKF03_02970 [Candidatus Saccharibacteria bacterium]|nr:hypothetical protein [Candidatus Saccharibacteria bacterium]